MELQNDRVRYRFILKYMIFFLHDMTDIPSLISSSYWHFIPLGTAGTSFTKPHNDKCKSIKSDDLVALSQLIQLVCHDHLREGVGYVGLGATTRQTEANYKRKLGDIFHVLMQIL